MHVFRAATYTQPLSVCVYEHDAHAHRSAISQLVSQNISTLRRGNISCKTTISDSAKHKGSRFGPTIIFTRPTSSSSVSLFDSPIVTPRVAGTEWRKHSERNAGSFYRSGDSAVFIRNRPTGVEHNTPPFHVCLLFGFYCSIFRKATVALRPLIGAGQ